MTGWIVQALGVGAALCSTISFAPQVVKIYQEKTAESVSLRMYSLTVTGFSLWIAYGLSLKSWQLVLSNAVCLLLSGAILALKIRYDRQS
jgi:MtN3 and saliva related transmembrane protein